VAALIIGVFVLIGQQILLYLGIRLPSLEAAGGLLLVVALDLLRGQVEGLSGGGEGQRRLRAPGGRRCWPARCDRGDHGVHARGEHGRPAGRGPLGLVGVLVVLWLALRITGVVRRLLGQAGIELVTLIWGLPLTAIAVQLVADAIREFVREGA
jgi:multiple antibiotic resistance protein